MKRAIALVVFFLGFSILGFSQEKKDLNHLTSGKWYFDSMHVGDETTELKQGDHWMSFSADGKYKIVQNSQQKEGTWQILEETQEIQFSSNEFQGITKITKLTAREFLFSMWEGDIAYTMKLTK